MIGMEKWRDIASLLRVLIVSKVNFQTVSLRYAEPPECFAEQNLFGGSDPDPAL